MSVRPGPLVLPPELVADAKKARDNSGAATKAIKDHNTAKKQAEEMRDLLVGCGSADAARHQLALKQGELKKLVDEKSKNVAQQAKLKLQIAQLQALADDFSGRDAKLQELAKEIASREDKVQTLTEEREKYTAAINAAAAMDAFKVDRKTMPVRDAENDLNRLRTVLETYRHSPISPSAPCLKVFADHIDQMQQAIDGEAHRSVCHRCRTRNGIPRSAEAKAKVFERIEQLRSLGARPTDDGLSGEQKADRVLAQSILAMSVTKDDTGATAGKMIGALICHTNDLPPREVVLYAYSGVVWDRQRAVSGLEKDVKELERQLQISPSDPELQRKLTEANSQLKEAERIDREANELLAMHGQWAPSRSGPADEFLSMGKAKEPKSALDLINGGNNIVGACSAPKLIQQAYALGLKPVALAEAWMGGGTNKDGVLVVSCDTCMSNIGFQLCEVCT